MSEKKECGAEDKQEPLEIEILDKPRQVSFVVMDYSESKKEDAKSAKQRN